MPEVTVNQTVNAPTSEVWKSWDDFANVHKFNPNLKGSHLMTGSPATGLGARRQCDMIDGKNYIREEILEYVPEKRVVVDIYDGTMPIKSAKATIELTKLGSNRTKVTMTMSFVPGMGLLGKIMAPVMKRQFTPMIKNFLAANAKYVESGAEVMAA